jgi:uncharacterized phage protein (TIGR02220 family)
VKIKPKKWDEFQHYKDRDPKWIKLHCKLLDDVVFQRLPRASQALAPMLWLLAAGHPEAIIDANPEDLAFRLRWPESELTEALSPLIGKGFFEVVQFDSKSLAVGKQSSSPEKERELETEKENPIVPLKRDGGRALKSERRQQAEHILEFLNGRAGRHFRPVPETLKFIEARLANGVTAQDLKTLIVRKCRDWLGTDMEKFLRPETLFNATKCQSYLGEIPPEDPACNAPTAAAASSPVSSPAPVDGAPPKPPRSASAPPTRSALAAPGPTALEGAAPFPVH